MSQWHLCISSVVTVMPGVCSQVARLLGCYGEVAKVTVVSADRDMGLVIQGIEANGRIYRDGRLAVHDRIIEINGTPLFDVDFTK